jgi:hypothetical protein
MKLLANENFPEASVLLGYFICVKHARENGKMQQDTGYLNTFIK